MAEPPQKSARLLARFRSALSPKSSGSDSAEGTSTEPTEPVSERRREQIRRAQRLHRQRKAEHTQRLAAEIADLRAKDATKTAKIDFLENTVAYLSALLNHNGIPHEIPKFQTSEGQAQISISVNPRVTAPNDPPQAIQVSLPTSLTNPMNGSALNIQLPDTTLVNLADAQLGIDFILTLEQPCFYHHHDPPDGDEGLLGHSGMMQAPIMARAPPLVLGSDGKTPQLPQSASWNVPSEQLERLLFFSNQIRLPSEITPVQAWSQIRERGNAAGWSPSKATLSLLLQTLKVIVSCHGFGAVMEKASFERMLDQYFQSA